MRYGHDLDMIRRLTVNDQIRVPLHQIAPAAVHVHLKLPGPSGDRFNGTVQFGDKSRGGALTSNRIPVIA